MRALLGWCYYLKQGKGRSTRCSRATIESEYDEEYDDHDKVAVNSDSKAESIKVCTVSVLYA